MYLPFFVLPYQREPFLWYTPVAVFTHTIPAPLSAGFAGFVAEGELAVFGSCSWLRIVRGAGLRGLGAKRGGADDERGGQKRGENEQSADRTTRAVVYRFASHGNRRLQNAGSPD